MYDFFVDVGSYYDTHLLHFFQLLQTLAVVSRLVEVLNYYRKEIAPANRLLNIRLSHIYKYLLQ